MTAEERVEQATAEYIQHLANILQEPNGYKLALFGIVAIVKAAKSKHGRLGGALGRIEAALLESAGGPPVPSLMQRSDVVAILRGLASKFHTEHDKTRKEQRAFSRHDPEAAAESGAWAGACANHARDVRKLADEIEAEGAKP